MFKIIATGKDEISIVRDMKIGYTVSINDDLNDNIEIDFLYKEFENECLIYLCSITARDREDEFEIQKDDDLSELLEKSLRPIIMNLSPVNSYSWAKVMNDAQEICNGIIGQLIDDKILHTI